MKIIVFTKCLVLMGEYLGFKNPQSHRLAHNFKATIFVSCGSTKIRTSFTSNHQSPNLSNVRLSYAVMCLSLNFHGSHGQLAAVALNAATKMRVVDCQDL